MRRSCERSLAVNFVAPVLLMRRFLVATAGRAALRRVINISSGAGRRPIFGWGAYCAAKAGIDMVSRVASLEAQAAQDGVEVVSLAPGVIDTPMQETRAQCQRRGLRRRRALPADEGRWRAARPRPTSPPTSCATRNPGKLFAEPVADLRTLDA